MKIAGLQKLSMVDYPGKMACTIFFAGCNFCCPYCHNSLLVRPEPDHEWMEEEEVLLYLKKRQGILEGVCISGGEPLLQGEKLIPFIEKIKALGYPVKLDTNGTFPELLVKLCEKGLVDYVAMDIKNAKENYGKAIGRTDREALGKAIGWTDRETLGKTIGRTEREYSGEDGSDGQKKERILQEDGACATARLFSDSSATFFQTDQIQKSIDFLLQGKVEYEFRTTLVKGIHEKSDVEQICAWIAGAKVWYLQNFKDSGNLLAPDQQVMDSFSESEINFIKELARERKIPAFVRNF